MENYELIKYNGGLVKTVENKISVTNKLLVSGERQKIIDLFVSHPEFFINLISKNFSLNEELIHFYEKEWNWSALSLNESIKWTGNLVAKYLEEWNWVGLKQ